MQSASETRESPRCSAGGEDGTGQCAPAGESYRCWTSGGLEQGEDKELELRLRGEKKSESVWGGSVRRIWEEKETMEEWDRRRGKRGRGRILAWGQGNECPLIDECDRVGHGAPGPMGQEDWYTHTAGIVRWKTLSSPCSLLIVKSFSLLHLSDLSLSSISMLYLLLPQGRPGACGRPGAGPPHCLRPQVTGHNTLIITSLPWLSCPTWLNQGVSKH